jgi:hypothetical protein
MICWIIEDDYKSEFRQPGGALPPLQGLDGLGRSSDPPPLCTNPLRCTLYGYPFRQAVELPHDERIAAAREFERVMQSRAVVNRTRHDHQGV